MNQRLTRREFMKLAGKAATAAALSGVYPFITHAGMSDAGILLKNGMIVDGSGAKAVMGDLLIKEGRIADIAPGGLDFSGPTIDCGGKVISPGFIDVHSHMDRVLPGKGSLAMEAPYTGQGITTFVGGNCGFSVSGFKKESRFMDKVAPPGCSYEIQWNTLDEYNNMVSTKGLSHNLVHLTGHGTTRASIRGFDASPMNPDEMKEMLYLLEESMEMGARGVSLGLQYEPGIFSTPEELKAVAERVKSRDNLLTVHMKAYSSLSGTYPLELFGTPHNLIAIQEMIDLARQTGVRMQLSHLIFVGKQTWKTYEQALEMIDKARAEGIDIAFDTYAYHCGTSYITVVMPTWFMDDIENKIKSRTALLKLRAELTLIKTLLGFGYEHIQIINAKDPELEQYNGMFARDIAKARGMGEFENYLDMVHRSGGKARVLNHCYSNREQVHAMIKHPASLLQTDATVTAKGVQNPATYGNFPLMLQYARDYHLLSLEEMVHKMTHAAAQRYQIPERGLLKKGYAADITLFDWEKVRDNNTATKTDQAPEGIEMVFINGRCVKKGNWIDTSSAPGVVL